jgi:NarL family two-component system response regulator YdfI
MGLGQQPAQGIGEFVPKQILVVDDSAMIRRLVRASIEMKTDWEVCGEAEDGEVAVRMVAKLKPDLVIMDLIMPVMDGLEAARRIASIAPNTPMVMFTMQDAGPLLQDAQAAGIKEVLYKSDAGTDHLIASMRSLMDRAS